MKLRIPIALFIAMAFLLIIASSGRVQAQTSTTTVTVTPQSSTPVVGQTLTINIQLNNVQNLYSLDVTLNWNPSFLSLQTNQSFVGVESYSNGVLHNPTSVIQDTASKETGEYHLVATSVNPASAFSGSGTIATLTFTVTSAGQSSLTLNSTLADHPSPGENSEHITHNDLSGTVDATLSSSSPSPSSSASSSPSYSSFPSSSFLQSTTFLELLAIIAVVVIVLVSAAVLLSRKIMKRTISASS